MNRSLFLCFILLLACTAPIWAQIEPDFDLSSALDAPILGETHIYPEDGTVSGANLFHGFTQFDIRSGEGAYFHNCPKPTGDEAIPLEPCEGIDNILARVRSAENKESEIHGSLRSDANLFLMNRNGIVIGEDAEIDVNGSFTATTADVIRFEDGGELHSDLGGGDVLSAANPTDFGFLSATPQDIAVRSATVRASSVELRSAKDVTIDSGSRIEATGADSLLISGDNVTIDGPGTIVAASRFNQEGENPQGSLLISGTDSVSITNGAIVKAQVVQGSVIEAPEGTLEIDGGTLELSGGPAELKGRNVRISGGADATNPQVEVYPTSNGAEETTLLVHADETLTIEDGQILSRPLGNLGNSPAIDLAAANVSINGNVEDAQRGLITLSEDGEAGGINVNATETLSLSGTGIIHSQAAGAGKADDIELTAETIQLSPPSGGGLIPMIATQSVEGRDGHIDIRQTDGTLMLPADFAARGGSLHLSADDATIDGASIRMSEADTQDRAVHLEIANRLHVTGSSVIEARNEDRPVGGKILIEAEQALIDDSAEIRTWSEDSDPTGDIEIRTAGTTRIFDATVETEAENSGSGDAGGIAIDADAIELENAMLVLRSEDGATATILLTAAGTISADASLLTNEAEESAGDIVLNAGGNITTNGSSFTTDAEDGGNIALYASADIRGRDNMLTTMATLGGANIELEANCIDLRDTTITATVLMGDGGNIRFRSDVCTIIIGDLDASSTDDGGNICFEGDGQILYDRERARATGEIKEPKGPSLPVPPPPDVFDPSPISPVAIVTRDEELEDLHPSKVPPGQSTFYPAGRGGVPLDPWNYMPSNADAHSS